MNVGYLCLLSVARDRNQDFSFVVPDWWNSLFNTSRVYGQPWYIQEVFKDPPLYHSSVALIYLRNAPTIVL